MKNISPESMSNNCLIKSIGTTGVIEEKDPPAYSKTLEHFQNNIHHMNIKSHTINGTYEKFMQPKENRIQQFSRKIRSYLFSQEKIVQTKNKFYKKLFLPNVLVENFLRTKKTNTSYSSNLKHSLMNVKFDTVFVITLTFILGTFEFTKGYSSELFLKQNLSDLDETQLQELMQTESEAELKYAIWKEINREYLADNITKCSTEVSDHSIKYQERHPRRRYRHPNSDRTLTNIYLNSNKTKTAASLMTFHKKVSHRVNYNALSSLFLELK